MSATGAADADAFHDRDELWGIAPLARSDQQGQGAASTLTGQMNLAGQTAPGASWSLVGAVLPGRASFPGTRGAVSRAPAACWWARQEVESTLTMDQSMRPSASARTAAKTLSHVPSADQRLRRSYTVFHGPKRAGRSRHGTPVRSRHKMPLMTLRWLAQRPPRCPDFGRCGFSRVHSACVKSPRPLLMPTTRSRGGHKIRRTCPRARCGRSGTSAATFCDLATGPFYRCLDLTNPRATTAHPAAKPGVPISQAERLRPPPRNELPLICRQPTITIHSGDLGKLDKYRQERHYLHPTWQDAYRPGRANIEGLNGRIKGRDIDVADPRNRLAHGRVAQTILLALMICSINTSDRPRKRQDPARSIRSDGIS